MRQDWRASLMESKRINFIELQLQQDQENPNPEDKTISFANIFLKILLVNEDQDTEIDQNLNSSWVFSRKEDNRETTEIIDRYGAIEGEDP